MFHSLRHVLHSLVLLIVVLGASTFVLGARVDVLRVVAVYVAVTLMLAALMYLQKPAPRVRGEWHYLTPSAMEWFGLLGCFTLTALLLWVYYFVGSARADAVSQMFVLQLLILAFAAGTALIFYNSFASELRWNEHTIEQNQAFRSPKAIKFADIVDGGMNPLTQSVWIATAGGTIIQFSPYANGAEALARTIFPPGRKAPLR